MSNRLATTVALVAATAMIFIGGVSQAAQKGEGMQAVDQQKNAPAMKQPQDKTMSEEGAELETGKKNMASSEDRQEAVNTVQMATKVFENFTGEADKTIPASVLQNAAGIVIIPDVIKAGLIAGGRHGTGVLVAKNQNQWSLPVFVSITGGSLGAQIGVESSDLVFVFNKKENLKDILQGSDFTLGADASVTAGYTGAKAKASTKDAEILAYQNTNGLFAGASITGSVLTLSEDSTQAYYDLDDEAVRGYYGGQGQDEKVYQHIVDKGEQAEGGKKLIQKIPPSAENLREALDSYASNQKKMVQ
jgi:lipid-binding SYLF domain-containing protein